MGVLSGRWHRPPLLLEVVRLDGSKEWAFIQHATDLPLTLVEYAIVHAKKELGPFFEG